MCVCLDSIRMNTKIKQFYELLSMEIMSYNMFIDSLLKSSDIYSEMEMCHLLQLPWIWDTVFDPLTSSERLVNIDCFQLLCINSYTEFTSHKGRISNWILILCMI